MKRASLYILTAAVFSSCSGWDGESKESFHSSCVESVKATGKTEAQAKSTCDCRLELVMKKYPSVEEALEHMVEITQDPEMAACK